MSTRSTVPMALAIGCLVTAGVTGAEALPGAAQLSNATSDGVVPVASTYAIRSYSVRKGTRITPNTSVAMRKAILANPRYNAKINACWG